MSDEDSKKMKLKFEYEGSATHVAFGAAALLVLNDVAKQSPEIAKAFKNALKNGGVDQLASKILANDDVAQVVNKIANSDDFIKATANLPDDSIFSKIGRPIKNHFLRHSANGEESGGEEGGGEGAESTDAFEGAEGLQEGEGVEGIESLEGSEDLEAALEEAMSGSGEVMQGMIQASLEGSEGFFEWIGEAVGEIFEFLTDL